MKFYRTFQPFRLISFDLDDTLYDNHPIIRLAEEKFLQALTKCGVALSTTQWQQAKQQVQQQDPIGCEDVVQWRIKTLQQILQQYNFTFSQREQICDIAMTEFVHWRHQISVPKESIAVLNQLKSHFILVAITNGNVDPVQIGLTQFDLVLRGGEHGRAKPHSELFLQTANYFNLNPQQILHVGDHLITDVQGAIHAGCQGAWLNIDQPSLRHHPQARILPTLEIQSLTELLSFCTN